MGSKRLFATEIVREILARDPEHVFDLCSGSGAVSIALVREGYPAKQITMVDSGAWGAFWRKLTLGKLNLGWIHDFLFKRWPDPRSSEHMRAFARAAPFSPEAFLVLQMTSRGGMATWHDGTAWRNSSKGEFFIPRGELHLERQNTWARLLALVEIMRGVRAIHEDVCKVGPWWVRGGIRYLDPPYANTRTYGRNLDLEDFVLRIPRPLLVSEQRKLEGANRVIMLGSRVGKSLGGGRTRAVEELLHVFE